MTGPEVQDRMAALAAPSAWRDMGRVPADLGREGMDGRRILAAVVDLSCDAVGDHRDDPVAVRRLAA